MPMAQPGPMALVGSGEFLPVMDEIDLELLDGRPRRAVFLPTAAAQEGTGRVRYWVDLGTSHFQRLGLEAVPLPVLTRADADAPTLAALVAGAGIVYLSGGNPGYLAATLHGSVVWEAIEAEWRAGAALAGCSAGAIALTSHVPDVRAPDLPLAPGLGLLPHLQVLPHFDQIERWRPGLTADAIRVLPDGIHLIGIDEQTALVGGPARWTVRGRQAVWTFDRDGTRTAHQAGETLDLLSI
jgi:cyanophycinase